MARARLGLLTHVPSAQRLMTGHEVGERTLKCPDVQQTSNPAGERNDIRRGTRLVLLQKPQPRLGERQWQEAITGQTFYGRLFADGSGEQRLYMLGELAEGRAFEQSAD